VAVDDVVDDGGAGGGVVALEFADGDGPVVVTGGLGTLSVSMRDVVGVAIRAGTLAKAVSTIGRGVATGSLDSTSTTRRNGS
jgi:hypothetical protein